MRMLALPVIALIGLAGCDAPLDPNAPRVALAGDDLSARLSGRTLVMRPTENVGPQVATAELRPDGTAIVSADGDTRTMLWSIQGQGLCFTRPQQTRDANDCRTIGWIQGNSFAVFDTTKTPPEKIADGVIS